MKRADTARATHGIAPGVMLRLLVLLIIMPGTTGIGPYSHCAAADHQRFFNLTAEEVRIDSVLPFFSYTLPLGTDYDDSTYSVRLKYPEFVDMSRDDIALYQAVSGKELPEMPSVTTDIVVERKCGKLITSFVPLVYRDGKYKKLVSFMVEVKSKAKSAKVRRIAAATRATTDSYASHSVLATGTWAKIRVPETGIYQLTESLIKSAGFSDLSRVHVYGYGGELQNETLVADELAELDDLSEVATCTVGDRRLFYARGPVSWSSATTTTRTRNPYSDYGYYFLTEDSATPLSVDSTTFIDTYYPAYGDYHTLYEVDDFAWFEGGRNLFDATAISYGSSHSYTITTPGYDSTGKIAVSVTAGTDSKAQITINDSVVGSLTMTLSSSYEYGASATGTYTVRNLTDSNTVTITTSSGGPVHPDYIIAQFDTPRDMPDLATASFDVPEYVHTITNQDLHADEGYQMVIIIPTSQTLLTQAERLKSLHEEQDGLSVRIVPADELYNEFSSGTPDANAYRRYMKMLYDRAESDDDMPQYLVLFGDCAWDNRMNSSAWAGYDPDDFLLCFESENSFSKTSCYVNDGFFCCLDDGEGGNPLTTDKLDIAVGRFPVRETTDAETMVDKIESYMANDNAGAWQNTVMFMGDDGNENQHMIDADAIASALEEINPALLVKRVMWDAYTRVSTATGNTYPDVADVIKEQQAAGALMMNYSGHGAEQQISHEKVITLDDVKNFTNENLPLWVTASCDIAPFDGQTENIGEHLLYNQNGGAVAFFGTSRTVYVTRNKAINLAFVKRLFTKQDGKYISVGEAARIAKNDLIENREDLTANKLQYSLLGDPALMLHIPTLNAVIDSINGIAVDTTATDATLAQLKASSVATVKGHIESDGTPLTTFNGLVTATVRDSEEEITCKLNDTSSDGATTAFTYTDRTNTLFNGTDSVNNGAFSFSFAVPMDINYSDATGLINIFAVDSDTKETANGYCEQFTVGGTESTANDSIGPSIYCWLNSTSFSNGDNVNTTPYFYATITDDDGINTTGAGIGHDMVLVIDGEMARTYTLNDNFTFDFGSYTSGYTYYNIPELDEGEHSLKFRAWDILNNSSTVELSFNVVKGLTPTLYSIGVTNNPAYSTTTFIINHDRTGSDMDVRIEVFDTAGRILWQHDETAVPTSSAYTVTWDLTTSTGYALQTGVYLYRVWIGSDGGSMVSKAKKLIVINNN